MALMITFQGKSATGKTFTACRIEEYLKSLGIDAVCDTHTDRIMVNEDAEHIVNSFITGPKPAEVINVNMSAETSKPLTSFDHLKADPETFDYSYFLNKKYTWLTVSAELIIEIMNLAITNNWFAVLYPNTRDHKQSWIILTSGAATDTLKEFPFRIGFIPGELMKSELI